jgi:hypothetical protein
VLRVNFEPDRDLRPGASRIGIQSSVIPSPNAALNEGNNRANFRLRIDVCCCIFTVPLWSSPSRIFSYGRYNRISP